MMGRNLHACAAAVLAAALMGACTQRTTESAAPAAAAESGYTLDVFAHEAEKIYLVRSADGRATAARVTDAGSALMEASEAQALMPQRLAPAPEDGRLSISGPGFSLQITADQDAAGEGGRALVDINAGGQRVLVDAEGEGDEGRAVVHITGADAESARDFIDDADGLSSETRAQMRAALGL